MDLLLLVPSASTLLPFYKYPGQVLLLSNDLLSLGSSAAFLMDAMVSEINDASTIDSQCQVIKMKRLSDYS